MRKVMEGQVMTNKFIVGYAFGIVVGIIIHHVVI